MMPGISSRNFRIAATILSFCSSVTPGLNRNANMCMYMAPFTLLAKPLTLTKPVLFDSTVQAKLAANLLAGIGSATLFEAGFCKISVFGFFEVFFNELPGEK
jgi:hypothetical protein